MRVALFFASEAAGKALDPPSALWIIRATNVKRIDFNWPDNAIERAPNARKFVQFPATRSTII